LIRIQTKIIFLTTALSNKQVAEGHNYCLMLVAAPVADTLAVRVVEADKPVAVEVRNIPGEVPLGPLSHDAEEYNTLVLDRHSD